MNNFLKSFIDGVRIRKNEQIKEKFCLEKLGFFLEPFQPSSNFPTQQNLNFFGGNRNKNAEILANLNEDGSSYANGIVFYKDTKKNFVNFCFLRGMEKKLFVFDLLVMVVVDFIVQYAVGDLKLFGTEFQGFGSMILPIFVVWIVNAMLNRYFAFRTHQNLVEKTFLDERFLEG